MALVFREAHAAPDKKKINEEWFVLENTGGSAVSTGGLQVVAARKGKRGSVLGVIDPGFMLQPGEKIIVVSGVPGKKSHGEPPTRDGLRVYHLFQREGLLAGEGTTIRLAMNQVEVARITFDPATPTGLAAPPPVAAT
ncbi:MAG TPA: hypothetical protein VFH73_00940 [Polyangia bacterium]|jgi:hypothetical protein|nr:hypothetical protein [Polyangia bacterium]